MLPWTDENKDSSSQLQGDVSGIVRSSKLTVKAVRASERQRQKKPPITRSNDFCMGNRISNSNVNYKKTSTRSIIINNLKSIKDGNDPTITPPLI
jgi:hypothetical protein